VPIPPAVWVVGGVENFYSCFIFILVIFPLSLWVIPGSDYGECFESLADSLAMLGNSVKLLIVHLCGMTLLSLYVFAGLKVIKLLNSVTRVMMDIWRSLLIWGITLTYYYTVGDETEEFGERWAYPKSYLQLGGFVIAGFGQFCYAGVLKFPGKTDSWWGYPENNEEEQTLILSSGDGQNRSSVNLRTSVGRLGLIQGPLPSGNFMQGSMIGSQESSMSSLTASTNDGPRSRRQLHK